MATQNITLPVWRKAPIPVRAVQGEADSRTIITTLTDSAGQPEDLTGATVRLYVHKPDNTTVFMDGIISDATGGVCSFKLRYQATAAPGQAACEVYATWPDNRTLKAVGLTLDIQPSNLEGAVESSDDFSALIVALNAVQATVSMANQAAADAKAALANSSMAISSANTAASAANTATVSANTAAAVANQAAADTAEKYRMINPLTGQEDCVTNILDQLREFIFTGAITAQEFDNLHLTADQFDALMISARDFDTKAKIKLGVA